MNNNLICIGKIVSAHGIKGAFKIKSYTEKPRDLAKYSPLYNKSGEKQLKMNVISSNKDMLIATMDDVKTRNEAEKLKGKELYIHRDILPETDEEEFYYEDLVGLKVLLEDGEEFGSIIAIHNHGGGDVAEIKLKVSNSTELFAFTKEIFPTIAVKKGHVTLHPPEIEYINNEE